MWAHIPDSLLARVGRVEKVNGKVRCGWDLGWGSGLVGSGQVRIVPDVGPAPPCTFSLGFPLGSFL